MIYKIGNNLESDDTTQHSFNRYDQENNLLEEVHSDVYCSEVIRKTVPIMKSMRYENENF